MKKIRPSLLFLICIVSYLMFIPTQRSARDVNKMITSNIHAQSSKIDSIELYGWGNSATVPNPIPQDSFNTRTDFFVVIDTSEIIPIDQKYTGYHLCVGNKSTRVAQLPASDNKLYVIAEVFYKNQWRPIEYIHGSSCGNSYHHVYLAPEEYWKFQVVQYRGNIPTKLRYKLETLAGNIYSTPINASFNIGQLRKEYSLYNYYFFRS
jgi:hypothetical protein